MERFRLLSAMATLPLVVACGSSTSDQGAPASGGHSHHATGGTSSTGGAFAGNGGTGSTPSTGSGGAHVDPGPDAPALCSREGDDPVRDAFCAGSPPTIGGFTDLYDLFRPPPDFYGYGTGALSGASAVSLGHSTALSGRLVSPINPRVLLPGGSGADSLFIAFQRGVQQVEIAAVDRSFTTVNLYLVTFRQACNEASGGCTHGDLYTPAVEQNWLDVHLEDAEDLKNTTSDCRQCHQRGTERATLLMRELEAPWTHFFAPITSTDQDVLYSGMDGGLFSQLYAEAKGAEKYGGLPIEGIQQTSGFALQLSVPQEQPLLFDSSGIMNEHFPYVEGQPWPGTGSRSAIWDREYEAFKRGEHLALPYFDALVTDPRKLAAATDAYSRFRAGELAAADLPDLADVHPEDPQTRAEIGLDVEPGASPADALIQACTPCHNDVLDQSLSRARFNVAANRLDARELVTAVDRLSLPSNDPRAMPPREARQLDPDTRKRLVTYLQTAQFPQDDVTRLEHAATHGMAGNTAPF